MTGQRLWQVRLRNKKKTSEMEVAPPKERLANLADVANIANLADTE